MHTFRYTLLAMLLTGALAGCTSGNSGIEPPFSGTNFSNDRLQLAVGVATFYSGAPGTVTTGLNAVATFRQPSGFSATLLNVPTLTGPFGVPAGVSGTTSAGISTAGGSPPSSCSPNGDASTNHVTGSAQALTGAACTTLGQAGGVYAYGFAPDNSTTSGAANYGYAFQPYFSTFSDATTAKSRQLQFVGGPPAYPVLTTSTPGGFPGYPQGWTIFTIPPVTGQYSLSVSIPSANTPTQTVTAPTATLTTTTGLAAFAAAPTFTSDAAGGGTVTCTAPAGVTETIVDIRDATTNAYYTNVVQGGGAVSATFGDALGPQAATGVTQPTLNSGDVYRVECIGVDYPAFEAGPPGNLSITPTITGANGQADITISRYTQGTY